MSIEERIPASHPVRRIRKLADQLLEAKRSGPEALGEVPGEADGRTGGQAA
jgi:hypothetical protein